MNLNINNDESLINDFIFCWDLFKKRPNKLKLHQTYLTSGIKEKLNSYKEENIFTEVLPSGEDFIINERFLLRVNESILLSYVSLDKNLGESLSTDLYFLYKEKENITEIEKIIENISEFIIDYDVYDISKINMVVVNNGVLDTEPLNNDKDNENIELFYNKSTFKNVNKLIKSIKNKKYGLSILNGDRGTGKTSIIKFISSKIDNVILYIPNSLLELTINNPEFYKFLRRFNNPVLVIDDCEILLSDLFSKSNIISNNIAQMVDGLNSLDINIIAIFNCKVDEIDSNLLDTNSLNNLVEFKELDFSEINLLCNHLGIKSKYKNKTRLIDIIRKEKKEDTYKIGFL
jgi:hypothetical protein